MYRVIRALLVIVIALTAITIIAFGVEWYLLAQPTDINPNMIPVPSTTVDAERFDSKVAAFEGELDQAYFGEEISLILSHEEVTSKANELIKRTDLPVDVQSILVNFRDGKIWALAQVNVGVEVSVGIIATVNIDNYSRPELVVEQCRIGKGALLPPGSREQIMSAITNQQTLADYTESLSIRLRNVLIEDGQLVITGTTTVPSSLKAYAQSEVNPTKSAVLRGPTQQTWH